MEKNYYYLDGQTYFGPHTQSEILDMKLTKTTLIWKIGMKDWKSISEFPEFNKENDIQEVIPPPPPVDSSIQELSKGEVKNQIKERHHLRPSKDAIIFFIIWLLFHLVAVIMSTSEIIELSFGPDSEKFWPFVEFYDHEAGWSYGIFNCYDWSEFFVYVFGFILIYYLFKFIMIPESEL